MAYQHILLYIYVYGCTTWTLKKRLENYTRMLRAILNKSWRQHSTKPQLFGHLPPFRKTIKVRLTRYAKHCWRSRDELLSDILEQKQEDQLKPTYSSSVRIRDVALRTGKKRWTIGWSGTTWCWWCWWWLLSI